MQDVNDIPDNQDVYFYAELIHVSQRIRLTAVNGKAVIVKGTTGSRWTWAPGRRAQTEVAPGLQIEVWDATIRKETI